MKPDRCAEDFAQQMNQRERRAWQVDVNTMTIVSQQRTEENTVSKTAQTLDWKNPDGVGLGFVFTENRWDHDVYQDGWWRVYRELPPIDNGWIAMYDPSTSGRDPHVLSVDGKLLPMSYRAIDPPDGRGYWKTSAEAMAAVDLYVENHPAKRP